MSSGITWKTTTPNPATVSSSSTDSSTTPGARTTGSTSAAQGAYVDPKLALEQSSFDTQKPITKAQAGHRLLANNPPLPSDGVNMNSETRALATATQEKMHSIANAFGQSYSAGVAQAAGTNPTRGVERAADDPSVFDGNDGSNVNPFGDGTGSSPMSVPSGSAGSDGNTLTSSVGSDSAETTTTSTTTDSYPTNSTAQKAADKVLSDAEKGGKCHHQSMQQEHVKDRMKKDGLSGAEVDWAMSKMKDKDNGSGQLLADAIVAMEQNPKMKPQLMAAISTMSNTESATTGSGKSATAAATQYDEAAQSLTSLVQQAGMTNIGSGADGFVIGASMSPPPTPGQNGWTIWAPETET